MIILHTADIHLDSNLSSNLGSKKGKERKNEILERFIGMIEYADANSVSAILISGDLFDVKKIGMTIRNRVWDAIVNHPRINFFYLKGNHDYDNFIDDEEDIPKNLFLFSDDWKSYTLGESDKVVVTGAELTGNDNGLYDSLFLEPNKFNIVMLHGQQAMSASKDKAEIIDVKALKNKNIDYLALGHIHSHKEEMIDGRCRLVYPGCLDPRGFDECGEHGFVRIDIDEEHGTYEHQFIKWASRSLFEIHVDITDMTTTPEILTACETAVKEESPEDEDLIKIILEGETDIDAEKDTGVIVKHFEPLFYFVKVYDKSTVKVDYESFMLDKSLKGSFVRTVKERTDLTEEEKAVVIKYGLGAIRGEAPSECD